MKKKIVTMLCSLILCLATACGNKMVKTDKVVSEKLSTDKVEVDTKKNAKAEADEKPDANLPIEADTEVPIAPKGSDTKVSAVSMDILNDEVYGKTKVNDVLVNDYVFEQDKSADYGVHSTSSKDAEAFLREDGTFDYRALGETGNYDFTGRFAYPEVKTSKRLQNLYLEYQSDLSTHYTFSDGGENQGVIGIYLGHDNYMLCYDPNAHVDGVVDFTEFATLETPDGGDVLVYVKDTAAKDKYSVYYYKLGAFSIKVQRNMNDELYTKAEFQDIMDNIILQ